MATTVTLKPNAIDISGSASGTTTLQATAVAGTTTLTLPAATDTLVGKATTDTLTNKTLTGAVMNGTLGATTPSTVAATTISASSTATFAAGTAALPAITTTGDTNTGIFFPAADTIAFTEGGVERMRIDSAGNLGLGVTPSAWGGIYRAFNIGTTAGSFVAGRTDSVAGRQIQMGVSVFYNGTDWIRTTASAPAKFVVNDSTFIWQQASSGTIGTSATFTDAMTLDASGRLGIGNSNPVERLEVVNTSGAVTAKIWSATNTTPIASLELQRGTNATWGADTYGDYRIRNDAGALLFQYGESSVTTERMRIDSAGNVLVTNAAGLGYGTGAGGTVTQATSRTTGVTLSKPTGAITMFSAAGSATAATFTVTNTLVAATDTIILNQKSGTNLYVLLVTAVAAGSFNITFYTTGGTATDAPVINFALIKGVTA
jgi:hypothetical protein